jgi:predicted membrane channel-forming protein YqfA (hemolysin III family)
MKRLLPILTIIVGIILVIVSIFILASSTPTTLSQARLVSYIFGIASFALIIPSIIYLALKFKERYKQK